jgi:hypothetical protein
MRLSADQRRILAAVREGCVVKVHRTLDGAKTYRLHCSEAGGSRVEELAAAAVAALEQHGYLQSNMKFPAATLLLTPRGAQAAAAAAQ